MATKRSHAKNGKTHPAAHPVVFTDADVRPPALKGASPFSAALGGKLDGKLDGKPAPWLDFPVPGFQGPLHPTKGHINETTVDADDPRHKRPAPKSKEKGVKADGTPRQRAERGSRPIPPPARIAAVCALPDDEKLRTILASSEPREIGNVRRRAEHLLSIVMTRIDELKREAAEL